MGRRLALIIGVDDYQDVAFRPLGSAENDAREFAQWLVSPQGGSWVTTDLQFVQGSEATFERVKSLIMEICINVAGPDDLVFIYFAGHTFLDEGEGYLALVNTYCQQPETGLHLLSMVREMTGQCRAAQVVVILDCFQARKLWGTQDATRYDVLSSTLLDTLQQREGRLFLCSCRGDGLAPEVEEGVRGELVDHMIVGLSGQADELSTGQLTLQRLYTFLCNALDEQHQPQLFGRGSDAVLLVDKRAVASSAWMLETQNVPSVATSQSVAEKGTASSAWMLETQNVPSVASSQAVAEKGTTSSAWMLETQNVPSVATSQSVVEKVKTAWTWLLETQNVPSVATSQSVAERATVQRRAITDQVSLPLSPLPPTTSGLLALPGEGQQQGMVLLKQAQSLVQMQNSVGALTVLEQALQAEPTNIAVLVLKGELLGTANRFQEAMSTIDQVIRIDEGNALAWSIRAALLANMGQFLDALPAVEHSIELDPDNPKAIAIKAFIMTNLAPSRNELQNGWRSTLLLPKRRGGAASFVIGMAFQLLGLIIGAIGAGLPMLYATMPIFVIFLLESLGLVVLCINAARGSYLYGFTRFLLILLTSAIVVGILGELYKFGYYRLVQSLIAHQPTVGSVLFLSLWLALAATLPLLFACGGFIGGVGRRARRRRLMMSDAPILFHNL